MKYKQLTREQRYAISLGLKEGKTQKAIALQIGVSASTVSRDSDAIKVIVFIVIALRMRCRANGVNVSPAIVKFLAP